METYSRYISGTSAISYIVCKRGSLADLKYKEKEQRGRFGEIDEKISREEYTRCLIRRLLATQTKS